MAEVHLGSMLHLLTTRFQRQSITMPTQEEQQNLAVVTEYFDEYWNKANPEIVEKLCVDDFVINYPMHGPRYGKEAAKEMMRGLKEVSRFPCYISVDENFQLIAPGFSRHFVPRLPASSHREWALRCWAMDWWWDARWCCYWRFGGWFPGPRQYRQEDLLFRNYYIHSEGRQDY